MEISSTAEYFFFSIQNQIKVPKRDDEANYITIEGTKENIEEARKGIEEKVTDLELKNYSVEITKIKSELIPQFRGRNGKEAEKLEKGTKELKTIVDKLNNDIQIEPLIVKHFCSR